MRDIGKCAAVPKITQLICEQGGYKCPAAVPIITLLICEQGGYKCPATSAHVIEAEHHPIRVPVRSQPRAKPPAQPGRPIAHECELEWLLLTGADGVGEQAMSRPRLGHTAEVSVYEWAQHMVYAEFGFEARRMSRTAFKYYKRVTLVVRCSSAK